MAGWKRILCAIDFSPTSEEALKVASDLARRFEAQLTLVHVYQAPHPEDQGTILAPPEYFEKLADRANQALADLKRRAEALSERPVAATMLSGVPFAKIVEYTKEGNFDVIVMGTEGKTGLRRMFLGSVAGRVVRLAQCPVVTVHPPS
jgi:nucleotide-binding universal stress UspA family protein